MSEFTAAEAEQEVLEDFYRGLKNPLVDFTLKLYYDDRIEAWSDCIQVIEFLLQEELDGDSKEDYLTNWYNYNPQVENQKEIS